MIVESWCPARPKCLAICRVELAPSSYTARFGCGVAGIAAQEDLKEANQREMQVDPRVGGLLVGVGCGPGIIAVVQGFAWIVNDLHHARDTHAAIHADMHRTSRWTSYAARFSGLLCGSVSAEALPSTRNSKADGIGKSTRADKRSSHPLRSVILRVNELKGKPIMATHVKDRAIGEYEVSSRLDMLVGRS